MGFYKTKLILLLAGCLCLTGCFELIEEVSYSDAEAGTYLLTLNCSKSKSRLKALIKLDTFMNMNIPSEGEVRRHFQLAHDAVSKVPGITAADYTIDDENFIFTFSFKFDKTESMNKAINNAAMAVTNKSVLPYYNVFSYHNDTFVRRKTPNDSAAQQIKNSQQHLKLITGSKVTSIYRFQKQVLKSSNTKAAISKNKKAVMLQYDLPKILLDPSLFTNTITF
jgi:hypothetical protein